ncbi:hypothetical protein RJ640_001002 [Escallonia rubra]|uniref:(+)-neomenthol dehydrogenase-like n=1 Tax=Escallonia rubra TaxID=112253 RepID=A0AA88QKZ1_9ASTE|nr:hypothetical protein RJ640_001002 [Escallonia rubra]
MIEAFIPLLQLSDSPRIVNVSSATGKLKNISNEWAKGVLSVAESLTEERVDEVLNEFLKDFKEGALQAKCSPAFLAAYTLSKASMNAYTRILARKYPSFCINCVCPGYLKTNINHNTGRLTVEEGAACPVKLVLLPDGGPSGVFFVRDEASSFDSHSSLTMAEGVNGSTTQRYAVVTGANKGIGFEICKQLASHGITVVLTARDEKRGTEALEKLKGSGVSDHVVFHQLDVVDPASVASLAEFVKNQFGRLDILVNNAGIGGAVVDADAFKALGIGAGNIPNEWAKGVLSDAESLTEERVDEVLNEFLKDFQEGALQAKCWPAFLAAYTLSKASMNAYTRILARKYPSFCINCVCPGYVKTDINHNTGILTVEEGAACPVKLALLPDGGPSGLFFVRDEASSFEYAVVTGANKGIGFEICKQLASHGIIVVLTARDEKRGTEALEKLQGSGVSDHVVFHQLDVVDPASVASLAEFVKNQFGRLDILVNNAGLRGSEVDADTLEAVVTGAGSAHGDWWVSCRPYFNRMILFSHNLVSNLALCGIDELYVIEDCGKNIPNEWAKGVLSDAESLTEERVDDVLNEFLKDFKEGALQAKCWPAFMVAYAVTKASMNAYTRILARKYPSFCINCVCPGYVKTDINYNTCTFTVEEGAAGPVKRSVLPDGGPSGLFFFRDEASSFE